MKNGIAPLKTIIEACGGAEIFVEKVLPEILYGTQDNGYKAMMIPEEFSMKEIFEAVETTTFSVIMTALLSQKVMTAYEAEPGIIDQLITTFPSSLKTDTIPGAYLEGALKDIPEGGPYPHAASIQDKYVTIGWNKRGLILDITKEAIRFDQTGMVMVQAQRMGERAARDRESEGMYTIQEATVSGKTYNAYYPSNSQTALYQDAGATRHAYDNLITDVLENYTDLDLAMALFPIMKDEAGDPITIVPKILLVAKAVEPTAARLINNAKMPNISGSSVGNDQDNDYYKKFTVLGSSYIDAVSNNDWYLGDFKRQFIEKVTFPLEVLSRATPDNDANWERDIVAQFKVRRASKFGAVDYRFVVKSTGGG